MEAPPRKWPSAALGLLAVVLLLAVGVDSYRLVGQPFPGFICWDNGGLVALHRDGWTGPQAGLPLNGGRIVSVNGAAFVDGRTLLESVRSRPAGTPVSYEVDFAGQLHSYTVRSMTLTPLDYLVTFGNYLGNAAIFLAIGAIALYVRPDLLAAQVLALGALSIGSMLALCIDYFLNFRFIALFQIVEAAMPACIFYFALVFPRPLPAARNPFTALALLGLTLALAGTHMALFYSNPAAARNVTLTIFLLLALGTFAVLARMLHALLTANDPEDRSRAAVVFSGAMLAFLIPAVAILAFFLRGWTFSFGLVTSVLFLFPLTILVAVVRYDLLDAERFIRLTVGYAVATSGVVVLYSVTAVLLDALTPIPTEGPAAAFSLVLVFALLFEPLRKRAQLGVDRIYFRSTTSSGRLLEETGAALAGTIDVDAVAHIVEGGLQRALQTEWAELHVDPEVRPRDEPATLELPVAFRGDTLATMRSGPKQSGAPFSSTERDLVAALASQAALALHNARTIQALQETQEMLLRSERLAAIGQVAGSVAHGVRNPLASIRAAAQIAREITQEADTAEILSSVLSESDRLEQRIRYLLDFSRPFDPELRQTDLLPRLNAIADALTHQANSQHVEIRHDLGSKPILLETDLDYLEEALFELAGNALRAMPDSGVLTFRARTERRHVRISISDSGPGIPEAVQGRIFDLFFTTRPEGTGIGLATVRKVVEHLRGFVELDTTGSEGTTFVVTLPL